MATFVTVVAPLAMIALGVLLIQLFNRQPGEHGAAFHHGRSRAAVRGRRPRKEAG
ncbi:hypothetical protein ACFY30_17015 [Streptomyces sp. NPDC000345]|uniref:hypothetical protein n=1 Tax=Streptomyces sp. NPDC000345 TaxID=3364537 RepID=UPI00369D23FD